MDERLSAFLDDEANASETLALVAALAEDPALRRVWQRQLWGKAVLLGRGCAPALDPGFADRVMAALEPLPAVGAKVVRLPSRRPRTWRRSAAGFAVAASLVAVAILVSKPAGQRPDVAAPDTSMVASAPSAGAEPEQTAGQDQPVVARAQPSQDRWSVADPAVADSLNVYLIEHGGVAGSYGLSAATPSLVHLVTAQQDAWR